jgi:eukaryotic-like serine/threonine-protein kinase
MSDPTQSAEAVFTAALKLAEGRRAAYLQEVCGGDAQLRARVEALLQAISPPVGPQGTMVVSVPLTEQPGDKIGRYKLLQQIGAGGCGVVYMADQEEPVKRRVALKVIKPGMDTREVLGRFEAERQALALMDHPNIAKVLEAGATATGRPFFVMELVRGIPITRYCDENKLNTRQRLELFIQVCQAIQHAHQKGIIHRDIKPSNILVADHDGVPVPKIIDFGIAKATSGQTLTDKTVFTALEQFIGTPAYMSPEQANLSGLDVDTRSDIYSLGVLLYELLTGKTPFEARRFFEAGFDEIRRIIREEEPLRPSRKLSTLDAGEQTDTARSRQTDSPRLIHLVRGDLDWIVMKCLEKDRNRRYETANGLASDIMRHVNNEPVVARPPSNVYRFQKLVRRNKLVFAAGTGVAIALLVGLMVSTYLFIQERRAHDRALAAENMAEQRLSESEAISKFLTEVFQSPDPTRDGRTITVAETLDVAAKKLETDLAAHPARQAKLQATVAETYFELGLYREAIPLQEKIRDYYLGASGQRNPDTLTAISKLAASYFEVGRRDEALKLREEVLGFRREVSGPEHPDTLQAMHDLAFSYHYAGRLTEALKLREEALTLRRKVSGPEHPDTLLVMHDLATSYDEAGRRDEARKLREELLPLRRKVSGLEHPETLWAMSDLAASYDEAGRRDEAIKLQEEVLDLRRKVNGPEHPDTLMAMSALATFYDDVGRRDEALKLREEVLPLRNKVSGMEHLYTLWAMQDLATSYEEAGRRDEALKLWEKVLAIRRRVNGPEHPDTLWTMHNLALSYAEAGRRSEAIKLQEEVLALRLKVQGPEHPDTLAAIHDLAESYCYVGRSREVIALQLRACEASPNDSLPLLILATWQAWFGPDADYDATRRRMVQLAEGTDQIATLERTARAYCLRPSTDKVQLEKVLKLARRAVELGKSDPWLPWYELGLGLAEYRDGQYADAERSLAVAEQKAVERQNILGTDILGTVRLFRAMSLFQQDRTEEARKLFKQAEAQMPPLPADENKPFVDGKLTYDSVLICWLAYKEAKSLLNEPATAKP